MKKFKELKYNGKIVEDNYEIEKILIQNKFNWVLDAEIENARIEILKNTFIFNAGTWYNGNFYYGVFRNGDWKFGIWENGVFYNGTWENGTFESGIIYGGKFINGEILSGDIRGGNFLNIDISDNVKRSDVKINEPEVKFKLNSENI